MTKNEKPIAYEISFYPYDELSLYNFQELVYNIYKREISNISLNNSLNNITSIQYDNVVFKTLFKNKDIRYCFLQNKGKDIARLNVKNNVLNINKMDIFKEVINFLLYYFYNKDLLSNYSNYNDCNAYNIEDINKFTYYFIFSNKLNLDLLNILNNFNIKVKKNSDYMVSLIYSCLEHFDINLINIKEISENNYKYFNSPKEVIYSKIVNKIIEALENIKIDYIQPDVLTNYLSKYPDIKNLFFNVIDIDCVDNKCIKRSLNNIELNNSEHIESNLNVFFNNKNKLINTIEIPYNIELDKEYNTDLLKKIRIDNKYLEIIQKNRNNIIKIFDIKNPVDLGLTILTKYNIDNYIQDIFTFVNEVDEALYLLETDFKQFIFRYKLEKIKPISPNLDFTIINKSNITLEKLLIYINPTKKILFFNSEDINSNNNVMYKNIEWIEEVLFLTENLENILNNKELKIFESNYIKSRESLKLSKYNIDKPYGDYSFRNKLFSYELIKEPIYRDWHMQLEKDKIRVDIKNLENYSNEKDKISVINKDIYVCNLLQKGESDTVTYEIFGENLEKKLIGNLTIKCI